MDTPADAYEGMLAQQNLEEMVSKYLWKCGQHTCPMRINMPTLQGANPRGMEKEGKACPKE
jgi:hypothetical protein